MSKVVWCAACQKHVIAVIGGELRFPPNTTAAAGGLPEVETTYTCSRCGWVFERSRGSKHPINRMGAT